jgi:hypothetical protein
MRRNSGSAAPSPFTQPGATPQGQPVQYAATPQAQTSQLLPQGLQTPQQQQAVLHQQQMQMQGIDQVRNGSLREGDEDRC